MTNSSKVSFLPIVISLPKLRPRSKLDEGQLESTKDRVIESKHGYLTAKIQGNDLLNKSFPKIVRL